MNAEINNIQVEFIYVNPDRVTDDNKGVKYLVPDLEGYDLQKMISLVGGNDNATIILGKYVRNKAILVNNANTEEVKNEADKVISSSRDDEKTLKGIKASLEATLSTVSAAKINAQYTQVKAEYDALLESIQDRCESGNLDSISMKTDPDCLKAKALKEEWKALQVKLVELKASK